MTVQLYSKCFKNHKKTNPKSLSFIGYRYFEIEIDNHFIFSSDDDVLNKVFCDIVNSFKDKHYSYDFVSYEVISMPTIKLKANIKKLYFQYINNKIKEYEY